MNRDELWQAIDQERSSLADLFDGLSDQEWETPSLCQGWRVRDVAAHLTLAQMGWRFGLTEFLKARGGFDRMVHDSAVRQAALPVRQYGILLRAMVGSRRKAPVISDLEPLIDAIVHGQDIAVPLGRERPVPPAAGAVAAQRVWEMSWPFFARRRMRGIRLAATDCDWSAGEGSLVEGPIGAILLVLTGRPAGASMLSGEGLVTLRRTG
ncbi:maleylpyruvate isomerase family mycothiol-dependent enzyme [Nonomuraea sediminis]|uniref:maleylpyruvate isomerase family mycothiol-dependent enzyme n=1 Tax=Nonomuraea sediminis TaxID=2835864 RepID=UPI001BDDB0EF|nr:maleylpyruvate isomerase family mycothiol-dependent enzyme [Nonomuraea sediminis]